MTVNLAFFSLFFPSTAHNDKSNYMHHILRAVHSCNNWFRINSGRYHDMSAIRVLLLTSVWQHTFVSPSAFSRRAVVSYWRKYVHEVLVNRLGGLSLPRKSVVRLTDRPDMTLDVYCGSKTTMQQNLLLTSCLSCTVHHKELFKLNKAKLNIHMGIK